jgi:alpha-ribazole phosphatase
MRTIYLIRHGKPEFPDERKYCIGRTDLPLSEEGRTQIKALGETFARRRIEKIYTSPLNRCRESAAILQEVIDRSIPIEVMDGLAEIDMGEWDGHSFDEIREQFPAEYAARGADMYDFRPPQGESFADCARRAKTTWNELRMKSRGDILVIGHAGWFRTLICGWEKRKDSLWLRTGV